MISVIAKLKVSNSDEVNMEELLRILRIKSLTEHGCFLYELSKKHSETFIEYIIFELWTSEEALEAHFLTEHFTHFECDSKHKILESSVEKFEYIKS